jgi:NAD(P)H-dependent FMN reductase
MQRKPFQIIAISGSVRKNSTNENILKHIASSFENLEFVFYNEIDKLPYFNPDLDKDGLLPQSVIDFRNAIKNADGVVICTPEYVFSLPGVLKNALEWTVSTTLFSNKPTAIIVASSAGEKTYESLSLIMQTLGASINNTKLLIKGARAKVIEGKLSEIEVELQINDLVKCFIENLNRS